MLLLVKLQAKAYNKAVVWLSHMVSESVKGGNSNFEKKKVFWGSFWRTVFYYFFSTRLRHFEIDIGKNCKTHTCTLEKNLSHLAGLAHLRMFIWTVLISPGWDPSKIKCYHTWAGWLTSHMNTLCFYRSFLKKVRSHLGQATHLTRPVHLHMSSP